MIFLTSVRAEDVICGGGRSWGFFASDLGKNGKSEAGDPGEKVYAEIVILSGTSHIGMRE